MSSGQFNMPRHYGYNTHNTENGNPQHGKQGAKANFCFCDPCKRKFPSQQDFITHIRSDPVHQQNLMRQSDYMGNQDMGSQSMGSQSMGSQNIQNMGSQSMGSQSMGNQSMSSQSMHSSHISHSETGYFLLERADRIPDGASCPLCHVVIGRGNSYSAHIGSSQHTQLYLQEISKHGPEQFYKSYGNVPYPDPPSGANSWSPLQEKDPFIVYVIRCGFYTGFECKACVQQCRNLDDYRHHIYTEEHNHRTRYRATEIGVEHYRKLHFDVPAFCQERLFKGRTSLVFPPPGDSKTDEIPVVPPTSMNAVQDLHTRAPDKTLSAYGNDGAYISGAEFGYQDSAGHDANRKRGHTSGSVAAEPSWDKRPRSSGPGNIGGPNEPSEVAKILATSNMGITDLQTIISVASAGGSGPLDAAKVISTLQQQLKASGKSNDGRQAGNVVDSSNLKITSPGMMDLTEREQSQKKRETASQVLSQETALLKSLKETVIRTANRSNTGPEQKAIMLQMIKILEQQQVVIYDYKNQKQQIEKETKQRREKEDCERRERQDKDEKERREKRERDSKFRKELENEKKDLDQKNRDFDLKVQGNEKMKMAKKKKVPTATLR